MPASGASVGHYRTGCQMGMMHGGMGVGRHSAPRSRAASAPIDTGVNGGRKVVTPEVPTASTLVPVCHYSQPQYIANCP